MAEHWGSSKDDSSIDNPVWRPIKVVPVGICVTWQEKYGMEKSETCIGLWENNSQYLLTWKDNKKIILEKANINSIKFE
jgi:hypothetical protein